MNNIDIVHVYHVQGKRVTFVECEECDKEIMCNIISDEDGEYADLPDECPHCGESPVFDCGPVDVREDFHSDI